MPSYETIQMSKNRYILFLLFLISTIILVMPVLPHHHHGNEIICMKNDVTEHDCCNHHHTEDDPCCNDKCATQIKTTVASLQADQTQPQHIIIVTLFTEPLLRFLTQPEETSSRNYSIYFESLHSTCIAQATGLRAPPCILS